MKTESKTIRLFSLTGVLNIQAGILFIVMILLSLPGISQPVKRLSALTDPETISKSLPDERVLLIPDRNIYLCGEDIVFEAYTYEGVWFLPVVSSSILYVELYNTDNKVISKGKYILGNGKGSGKITIPREILSDLYYIRGYTNYMKNFGTKQFFVTKLKIVNPFLGSPYVAPHSALSNDIDPIAFQLKKPPEKFLITIETDRKEYGNREEINVTIKAISKNGDPVKTDLTLLSVLTEDGRTDTALSESILMQSAEPEIEKIRLEGIRYLPEIKGDIISGKLVYKDGLPANGIKVLQSFTGKTTSIESSVTDKDGYFRFITNAQNNIGDLILKVQNTDKEISVIPDDEFYGEFPRQGRVALQLSENEIEFIARQFINIQVNDAYSDQNKNKDGKGEPEKLPFYGKEYVEYKFPDYLKLPNMKEFIFEVIQGVILARENEKEVIEIIDEKNFAKIGPHPLIIIDGVPVTEYSIVINLPSEKVKSIRVVRNKYLYKDQIFDGILDIITYQNNASSLDFPKDTYRYKFIHASEEKSLIESKLPTEVSGRVPVYKNLIYWNSEVATDKDGNAKVSFITPDNTGSFEIRCFGFTDDGTAGEGRIMIKVSK